MAGRSGDKKGNGSKPSRAKRVDAPTPPRSRVDRLVELVDFCTAAQAAADEMGERFLSYLLAMAIQESRIAIKREAAGQPPQPV